MSQDRRLYPRFPMKMHAEVVIEQRLYQGTTIDLNNTGALMNVEIGEIGEQLHGKQANLWLQSEQDDLMEFPCVVRHTYSQRLGLQFLGQDVSTGIKLRLLLNERKATQGKTSEDVA